MSGQDSEISRLMERYISQAMSEHDVEAWLHLCKEKPELSEELFDHFVLDEMLRDISRAGHSNSALAKAVAEVIEHRDRPWIQRHPFATVASALILLLSVFSLALLSTSRQHSRIEPTVIERQVVVKESIPEKIATLTGAVELSWESPKHYQVGDELYGETLQIRSGLAKLHFVNGVVLLLEGPAECQLISPLRIACSQGRLSAVVPPEAIGFRIDLQETSVVDLGTVFMIDASKQGSEIQVQQGRVALTNPSLEKAILDLRQAIRFIGQGPPRRFHADTSYARRIQELAAAGSERLNELYREEQARRADYPKILLPNCRVIAQRGILPGEKENTIDAFRKVASLGVDAVELDVVGAPNGTLFVSHPSKLKGKPGKDGKKIVPMNEYVSFPTFEEAMDFFRSETTCYVVVDVFEEGTEQQVVEAIDRSGIADRIILTGRFPQRVQKLKELRPSLCVGLCCDLDVFPPPTDRQIESIVQTAESVRADFVKLEKRILSPELIARCREEGIPIWCYTIDTKQEMDSCLESGAVGVLTGRSDLLLPFAKEIKPGSSEDSTEEDSLTE